MKRRLLTLAIFLLLGAVVNVAVAWGCAVWISYNDLFGTKITWSPQGDSPSMRWNVSLIQQPGLVSVESEKYHPEPNWVGRFAWREERAVRSDSDISPTDLLPSALNWAGLRQNMLVPELDSEPLPYERLWAIGWGWPWPSLWYEYGVWSQPKDRPVHGGMRLPLPLYGQATPEPKRALPLRPILFGFAINTFFYAAILWLLMLGPFALRRLIRRQIRRRRGLCPACAYDLRHAEHEACPECGLAA